MGHPETAEPRDGRGLMRGISTVDRARVEAASTHEGDPGLLHRPHAPHSAHQEGWWARVCQCGASPHPPSCTQASQLAS